MPDPIGGLLQPGNLSTGRPVIYPGKRTNQRARAEQPSTPGTGKGLTSTDLNVENNSNYLSGTCCAGWVCCGGRLTLVLMYHTTDNPTDGPIRLDVAHNALSGPSGAGTGLSVEVVERLVVQAKAAAYSVNTHRTYDVGYRNWTRWAVEHGHQAFPAAPEHVQMWLATLADQNMKSSTWRTYLAGVAFHHRGHDAANPAHDPQVRLLLRGLTRRAGTDGHTAEQAAPLRWNDIEHISDMAHEPRRNQPGGRTETLDQARQRAGTDVAMAAVAHDAALRSSELLALTWADIALSQPDRCATVTIRRSKSDQTSQGAVAPISEFASHALARLKPADPDSGQRIFNISASTLNRRLKTAARTAGIDPAGISSHSPRVGMAQDLAAHGITLVGLKQAGRWKTSTTASRYTQHLTARHTPAGQYLKTQHRTNPPDP